jgi:hypothetical protein
MRRVNSYKASNLNNNKINGNRDGIVGIEWLRAEWQGGRSSSPDKCKNVIFFTSSRPILGPAQPLTQRVLGAPSPGAKRPGRGVDHFHLHLVPKTQISNPRSFGHQQAVKWCIHRHSCELTATDLERTLHVHTLSKLSPLTHPSNPHSEITYGRNGRWSSCRSFTALLHYKQTRL